MVGVLGVSECWAGRRTPGPSQASPNIGINAFGVREGLKKYPVTCISRGAMLPGLGVGQGWGWEAGHAGKGVP